METTVSCAVLEAAESHPERPAIVAPDGSATYGELVAKAAKLAAAYRQHGVEAGDRVAVSLPPGRALAAVALAATMIGAAYVPLDAGLPAARRRMMLDRCAPRLCVAPSEEKEYEEPSRPILDPGVLRGEWPAYSAAEIGGADRSADSGGVAYVIHTSGSTGVPKAVEIEHRGLLNLLADMDRRAQVHDGHRGSWWTGPGFDVSVWELWSPLCRGGTVVVVPPEERLEGTRLAAFLDRMDVHSAYVPPAFLADLRDRLRADPASCPDLTRVLSGVEPVRLGLFQEILAERPTLTILNGYGPAEATICCTLYRVPRTGGDPHGRTPIGTAVEGMRLHLLGDDGRPAAIDVGELVVAGIGVGRGYLHGDSGGFTGEPGPRSSRAYRTGDLVRLRPDGELIFIGRVDRQLKVRGYRVEPAEVESAIRQVADVSDVVVGQRCASDEGAIIVAYVVVACGGKVDARELRSRLRTLLPAHALPTMVVPVDRMPLTGNGKIDYDRLATLSLPHGGDAGTAREADPAVAEAWCTALGVADIPPSASFLDLGGTSLSAVRAATALRTSTGRAISATEVLHAPSAQALAKQLDAAPPHRADPAAGRRGRTRGPLSPQQLSLWMHERAAADDTLYLESCCFQIDGPLDPDRLASAVRRAASAHPVFGSVVTAEGGIPELCLAGHDIGLDIAEPAAPVTDERLRELLESNMRRPFDLARGPLMRCVLVRLGERRSVLLAVWHHIVVDGWSVRLFLTDLARCYDDEDHTPATSRLTICDLNAMRQERSAGPATRQKLDSMAARLDGHPVTIDRPAHRSDVRCVATPFRLPGALTRVAEATAASAGLTISTLLCAAYQPALRMVLGCDRFLLGCATIDRPAPEQEAVAGYLVNTAILRSVGDIGPARAVRLVDEEMRTAIADAAVPVGAVVRRMMKGRRRTGVAFPELYFNVDEEPRLELDGLDCSYRPVLPQRARFRLLLSLRHRPGRLAGHLEYRTDLLTEASAGRLLEEFEAQVVRTARSLTVRGDSRDGENT
jgi:amino acid adenylation domain-containing protein